MMMAARKGRAAPRQDVAQDRRAAQIYPLERAVGRGIIGEQRKNSAHLRRPRRAILTPSRTKLRTSPRQISDQSRSSILGTGVVLRALLRAQRASVFFHSRTVAMED